MNTVYSEWNDYRDQVMSRDAGPDQVAEMRAAFVAGYFSALAGISKRIDIREHEFTIWKEFYQDAFQAINKEQTSMEERADGRAKP